MPGEHGAGGDGQHAARDAQQWPQGRLLLDGSHGDRHRHRHLRRGGRRLLGRNDHGHRLPGRHDDWGRWHGRRDDRRRLGGHHRGRRNQDTRRPFRRHISAEWLSSPEFGQIRAVYKQVCGRGGVYFRPVNGKLNVIALHRNAPAYIGHRANADDAGHVLRPGSVAIAEDLQRHHAAFERWLPSVTRGSNEERAVIGWLRRTLSRGIRLPELGEDWVLIHQEWRLRGDDGKSRKTDVLAVHVPTGQLGIIEAKSRHEQRPEAVAQLQDYRRLWLRDGSELAPFFTTLLQAMGRLYGDAAAAGGRVEVGEPALFFAWPGILGHVRVERLTGI